MPLLSQFCAPRWGESSIAEESLSLQSLHCPPPPSQFEVRSSPTPDSNGLSLPQHYARMAQDLQPSLSSSCRWLSPKDVDLVGEHPIAAGGFANILEAKYGGRKVVLKSYRCYVSFDVAQVIAVRCNSCLYQVHC